MSNPVSDEALNAFVDGEAGRAEGDRVFDLSGADAALDREVCALRKVKALVRHAYEVAPPTPGRAARVRGRGGRAAVVAVFALGAGAGWLASEWRGAPAGTAPLVAPGNPAVAVAPAAPGVVIQVADADEAKWRLALEQARIVAESPGTARLAVVVIAYGPGLDMLRGASPVSRELGESLAHGIQLVACGNTMHRDRVAAADLHPGVTIAGSGATLEILALQRAGYAYIRI